MKTTVAIVDSNRYPKNELTRRALEKLQYPSIEKE